jgi:C-terminal processing protease CtpA/Prc
MTRPPLGTVRFAGLVGLIGLAALPGVLSGCATARGGRVPAAAHDTAASSPEDQALRSSGVPAPVLRERQQTLAALRLVMAENFLDPGFGGVTLPALLDESRLALLTAPDAETFHLLLDRLLQRAGTGHLALIRPGQDLYRRETGRTRLVGATARRLDSGHVFVDDVFEGGPAARAGLLFGDELLPEGGHEAQLDPLPADRTSLTLWVRRARDAELFHLTLQPELGDTLEALAAASRSSLRLQEEGTCHVGVLHLRTLADDPLMQELLTGAQFDAADGLVLDLRGNRGGDVRLAGELFDLLTRQPTLRLSYRDRRFPFPATSWNRPLVVLVNEETRSAAEIFAAAVQARRLGPVIGMPTPGEVLGSRLFELPDGSRLLVPVSSVTLLDGTPLQGRGIRPDEQVDRPLLYAAGADPQMERAIESLRSVMACPEALPEEKFPQKAIPPVN